MAAAVTFLNMTRVPRFLLAAYAGAIFLSAALLFAVQPMFAKMVLPRLGGAPSVWSVAMVFFQATLLAGYAYAHALTRLVPGIRSVLIHLAVMIAALVMLPLAVAAEWGRPPPEREAAWLIGLFAVSIGFPFFALSANGPLLQAWFARTDHPAARSPYFLYAASNVGSFLALVAYPLAVEPFLRLGSQTRAWSVGYALLVVMVATCGAFLFLRGTGRGVATSLPATPAPRWQDAARWIALAAVPSGLLVAVTAHMSTDVAAVPLLWVIPLALYLASFVLVFQTKPLLRHSWMVAAQPFVLLALAAVMIFDWNKNLLAVVALNLAAFFVTAMVCHGELARRRPPADHLTAFYLWMSFGGMLGGLAAGLVAPRIFDWIAEYPLLLVLAVLCRPGLVAPAKAFPAALWLALAALMIAVAADPESLRVEMEETWFRGVVVVLCAATALFWRRPLEFAIVLALAFLVWRMAEPDHVQRETIRSFFGVHKIIDTADGAYRVLMHGTTIHGAQRLRDDDGKDIEGRPEPLTYYHASSPMAQAIADVRARLQRPIRAAVVGLGTGSLSCYAEPGDGFTFYEIDPTVVRFARDEPRFDFMRACAPDAGVVLGDARLTLAEHAGEPYDIIIVDAFSSDSIPVHLITREAVAGYRARLAPSGLLLLHVSNRHLELDSVALGVARANGLAALVNTGADENEDDAYKFSSTVIVAARTPGELAGLAARRGWSEGAVDPAQRVWSDDYTNVVGAILRKRR